MGISPSRGVLDIQVENFGISYHVSIIWDGRRYLREEIVGSFLQLLNVGQRVDTASKAT